MERLTDLRWYLAEDTRGWEVAAEWLRSVAVDGEGTVYVAAGMTGNEGRAVRDARHDGVREVSGVGGHWYLPVEWVVRQHPWLGGVCGGLVRSVERQRGG